MPENQPTMPGASRIASLRAERDLIRTTRPHAATDLQDRSDVYFLLDVVKILEDLIDAIQKGNRTEGIVRCACQSLLDTGQTNADGRHVYTCNDCGSTVTWSGNWEDPMHKERA